MFAILENFRESIPFILLGNIASSLKFELISCKIGLVFFCDGTWYLWTFLLPSTWLQLPWWKIVWCFKSRLHCRRLYIAFKAQKLLKVSEVFWSFTCIFKSKLLRTQSRLTNSEGRNIKLRCYCEWRMAKQQFSYKQCFQRNKTLTADTDDQKFNCDNADWTFTNRQCREVEFERQAVRTKATRSSLRLCLHTVNWTFIYTNFLLLWIWQI